MVLFISSVALVILAFLGPVVELLLATKTNKSPHGEATSRRLNTASKIAVSVLCLTLLAGLLKEGSARNARLEAIERAHRLQEEVTKLSNELSTSDAARRAFTLENELLHERLAAIRSENATLTQNLSTLADATRRTNSPPEYSTTMLAGRYTFVRADYRYEVHLLPNGTWTGKRIYPLFGSDALKGDWTVDHDKLRITTIANNLYGNPVRMNIIDERITYWLPGKRFETKSGTEFICAGDS
jgi:hypothetical protein